MIEIQNIITDSKDDIINLLLDEEQQAFHIYFPKYTVLFSNTNEDIANEYARLAYVGHKLYQSAETINYEAIISPQQHESILFEITAKNFGLLAECLLELSYLYENSNTESDEEYNYWEDVYQYIDEVESGKHIPASPEFIEIYKEFTAKD